jgi:hypothetical protein
MPSGRTVDALTFKRGHMGGAGKLRCPKCHEYAILKNVHGREVYQCRCGRTFKPTAVVSAPLFQL